MRRPSDRSPPKAWCTARSPERDWGKAGIQQVKLGSGTDSAWVITAAHPIVVGLTLLGADGASLSSAIPDPSYGG